MGHCRAAHPGSATGSVGCDEPGRDRRDRTPCPAVAPERGAEHRESRSRSSSGVAARKPAAPPDLAHLEFASARRLDYLRSLRRRGVAHRFAFFFAAFAATFGFAAAFDFDCADAFDFAATFNFVAPSSETRTRF